jgi:hypothetical protein
VQVVVGETLAALPVLEIDGPFMSPKLYSCAASRAFCVMKGSIVFLDLPVLELPDQRFDPLNDLSMAGVGYGALFGPMQFGESDRASPQRYLSPPLPSHFIGILANIRLEENSNTARTARTVFVLRPIFVKTALLKKI